MRRCELCNSQATISCESDQARLCWECDSRVHSANFLVAKHTRTLLCHFCQSHTPWTGSGPKLTPIVTSCTSCEKYEADGNEEDDDDGDEMEDDDDEEEDDEEEEEEEENQVVPWADSFSAATAASSLKGPSQVSGSSSGTHDQECSSRFDDRYPEVCTSRRGFPLK